MNCRGKQLDFGSSTHIMGVLNVTPDSFSDGGDYLDLDKAVLHAKTMVADGATIIDIGGESSRPGSDPVSAEVEVHRVLPVINDLVSEKLDVLLSIDTTKAVVAKQALEAGAHIINDITALRGDTAMAQVAAETEAGVILMHMKGTPRTMQRAPQYNDVVKDVYAELKTWIGNATQHGIAPDRVIIDPGIGFGKTTKQNLLILKHLDIFRSLNKPILIGTSRKSFIGNLLDVPVTERVEGTLATVCWSIAQGVDIVRVHDVKATTRAVRMTDALYRYSETDL